MVDTDISQLQSRFNDGDEYMNLLGIELVELEPGYARTELEVTEKLVNIHGTVHGGVIYTLADVALGAASNTRPGDAVALETETSYLRPASPGSTLVATATERHNGASTGAYEISVTDEEDTEIAVFWGRVFKL